MRNVRSFRQIYLLFLTIMIIFIGCKKEDNLTSSDVTGNWTVISYDDNVTNTKVTKTDSNTWPQYNNGDINVTFESKDLSTGTISGRTVSNSFYGTYELGAGSTIKLNDVIWTMVMEPLWGKLFGDIVSAESYQITGNKLKIFYNQKKNSITLIRD